VEAIQVVFMLFASVVHKILSIVETSSFFFSEANSS